MATFYTSDLHLGHKSVIDMTNRPFANVDEMDQALIKNWNNKVTASDDVWILGDLSYRSKVGIGFYMDQMLGHKHLIVGNHDYKWMKNCQNLGKYFESVEFMELQNDENKLYTLCHYPMLEWNRSGYATIQEVSTSWLIHGHIHNSTECDAYWYIKENLPCALNAGVDINGYAPVTFKEMLDNNNEWYGRI